MSMNELRDGTRGFNGQAVRNAAALIVVVAVVAFIGFSVLRVRTESANPALAPAGELAERPFSFTPHDTPRAVENIAFTDGSGTSRTLADFRGRVVLLNIWATWCAPCRKEMSALDRLQTQLGGDAFEVVALSIDRDGAPAVKRFFAETNVQALSIYVDTTMAATEKLATVGVPTTLLIDRDGREIARRTGPAEWDRPEVVAVIKRYLPPRGS